MFPKSRPKCTVVLYHSRFLFLFFILLFFYLDLAGISLSLFNNKVKHLIEQASKLAQDNYPEVLG
jgi:hypothetical protein